MRIWAMLAVAGLGLASGSTFAAATEGWTVRPDWVAAHEAFLASDALRGRGSATADEAVAANYVASQFQAYGLKPAPGMTGYLQVAQMVRPRRNSQIASDALPEQLVTTNAIGWVQGSDPNAGVILISAHLDHLGVRADGVIMHGANDDASGTTAVLELAHALASGRAPRRSVLFVCYGSEELGGLGSRYFGAHSPVPLADLVANLEFEMIGVHDPRMAPGVMMMTGFDRSDLGPTLQAHGAKVAPDLYPEQHFFERSDNYSLAMQGIVAHTISGWAVTPTYHDPADDLAHLDIPFMTQAIQSLIAPVKYLANSDFRPQWRPGGRP